MTISGKKNEYAIRATLFPTLTLSDGEHSINEEDIRSDMVVKLLSYLIYHHGRGCTAQELTSALWQDDESANPVGALKNLAYRLRTILKKTWPDREFVITGRGSYRWNPEIPVLLDTEEFISEIKKGERAEDPAAKIRHFSKAFELYQGRFLHSLESEYWVMPKVALYESTYLTLSRELTDLLEDAGRYEEMERVALASLEIEPYDERLHTALIRAYVAQSRQEDAEEHYRTTEKLLYDNLGIGPSDEMKSLFSSVMDQQHKQETDLAVIQKELHEAQLIKGAYLCEYGVFKKKYELEARRVPRMGMTIYLSLLTLHAEKRAGNAVAPREERELMEKAMEQVVGVVISSLRAGDVLTRYSANQYLIMLPACPYENAKAVMERIMRNFEKVHRRVRVRMLYSLKEMETGSLVSQGYPLYNVSTLRLLVDKLDPETKEMTGSIVGIAIEGKYRFGGTGEFVQLVDRLLNRIGKPQPARLQRNFVRDEKYVSYKPMPEVVRDVEDVEQERGLAATYDMEFQSRAYNTWQGLLYGEGLEAVPFSSELELVGLICGKKDS